MNISYLFTEFYWHCSLFCSSVFDVMYFQQNNPKIKAEEIDQLHKQLMTQANASMATLQKKLQQQKVAEEQDRLRKIQEEMEREKMRREEEERKKKEEEDTRKK